MSSESPFVLVHGAWHGAWCWEKLAPRLRDAGREVLTPTLAGMGERAGELRDGIDLTTHAREVAALIEKESLRDVVLVGHSYAGMVITSVWDRLPSRIRQVVYLDAFFPEDGRCFRDYCDEGLWSAIEQHRSRSEPWRVPFPFPLEILGVEDAADRAWIEPRLRQSDFPFPAFLEPVKLSRGGPGAGEASYVLTSELPVFTEACARAERAGLRTERAPGGHDAMVTAPARLAELLSNLAA